MRIIRESWAILLGLVLSVALILGISIWNHQKMNEIHDRFWRLGKEVYRKYYLISGFERLMMDMETWERGYLITGDPKFLDPYHKAQEKLTPIYRELLQSLRKGTLFYRKVEECWSLSRQWIQEAALPEIEMRTAMKPDGIAMAALADRIRQEKGKKIMDTLRLRVKELEQMFDQKRKEQITELGHLNRDVLTRTWFLVGFLILVIGGIEWVAFLRMWRLEDARTKLAESQARLKASVVHLQEATRLKSEFLANMSHEVRTPLNAILGFAQILQKEYYGPLNEKQREHLNYIMDSGQHLLSLINDILDLSKVEAGRMDLELSTFPLKTALEKGLNLFREKAYKHHIDLGLEVDEEIGLITADEQKLRQILYNLLSNAFKFTPDGESIHVSASLVSDSTEGEKGPSAIKINVADTGIGIPLDEQEKIFEPFTQVDGSHTRKYEGTGLGLSLVKRFVELHGGRIWVESRGKRKGSTFSFVLPLKASDRTKENENEAHTGS